IDRDLAAELKERPAGIGGAQHGPAKSCSAYQQRHEQNGPASFPQNGECPRERNGFLDLSAGVIILFLHIVCIKRNGGSEIRFARRTRWCLAPSAVDQQKRQADHSPPRSIS